MIKVHVTETDTDLARVKVSLDGKAGDIIIDALSMLLAIANSIEDEIGKKDADLFRSIMSGSLGRDDFWELPCDYESTEEGALS